MTGMVYGRTADGRPADDERDSPMTPKTRSGASTCGVGAVGRGRPPLGAAATSVELVRLDPETRAAVAERAAEDGVSVSEVIRRALGE